MEVLEFGGVFEETSMEPYAGDKFIHVVFKALSSPLERPLRDEDKMLK